MPGNDFEIFWEGKWRNSKSTRATRLNLMSNDSEDIVFYLFVIHFDALSRSENDLFEKIELMICG